MQRWRWEYERKQARHFARAVGYLVLSYGLRDVDLGTRCSLNADDKDLCIIIIISFALISLALITVGIAVECLDVGNRYVSSAYGVLDSLCGCELLVVYLWIYDAVWTSHPHTDFKCIMVILTWE